MKPNFIIMLATLASMIACKEAPKQATTNYTVIVSLDGFRHHYRQWFNTPNLDDIGNKGVQAVMTPSFPASTFPNHYTIATGLRPEHHGIVNNTFYDTRRKELFSLGLPTKTDATFYGGEPIWNTAVKQGVKVGTAYWVASDMHIQGIDPTYYLSWDANPKQLPFEQRIDTVISWLSKPYGERPQLVMSYFEEPDHVGHVFSPRGDSTRICIEMLDSLMGVFRSKLSKLEIADSINFIVTSDHGMATMSAERTIKPYDHIKEEWIERMITGRPTSIFTKPEHREDVYNALKKVEHIEVWKREEIPADVGYGAYADRIGDIVVSPEVGWEFAHKPLSIVGAHGFRPTEDQMKVMFVAEGPDFKENHTHTPFLNVDIYGMLAQLLNITPVKTDGDINRVKGMLR